MHAELKKECPLCPKVKTRRGDMMGIELELIHDNYSGCGVDLCRCPECGKDFRVSFKIDEITEILRK
jgi:hypothetical protein